MKPKNFKTASDFREWLVANGSSETELWILFYKKGTEKASVSYPEAVEEALCFGWIDGIRKKIDDVSYTNRFTPRRPKSNWSLINIGHAKRLIKEGRMTPAGKKEVDLAKKDGRWDKS